MSEIGLADDLLISPFSVAPFCVYIPLASLSALEPFKPKNAKTPVHKINKGDGWFHRKRPFPDPCSTFDSVSKTTTR
jgi:hypothetical protein